MIYIDQIHHSSFSIQSNIILGNIASLGKYSKKYFFKNFLCLSSKCGAIKDLSELRRAIAAVFLQGV